MSTETNNGNGRVSGLEVDIRWMREGLGEIKQSLKDLVTRLDRDGERVERRIEAVEAENRQEHEDLKEQTARNTNAIRIIAWAGSVALTLALAFAGAVMSGLGQSFWKTLTGGGK